MERIFLSRHKDVFWQYIKAFGNLLPQVILDRIHPTVEHVSVHATRKCQFADELAWILYKVAVYISKTLSTVLEIFNQHLIGLHPILAVLFCSGIFLEENNVSGDIRQCVTSKGCFRQTDGSQKVRFLGNLFSCGWINRVHEKTADHKGSHTAFTQQVYGLGQKVVMDGKATQFRIVRVKKRLLPERWITHYRINPPSTDIAVLEADIEMLGFRVQVLGNG